MTWTAAAGQPRSTLTRRKPDMSKDALTSYTELADVLDHLPLLVREKRRRLGLSLRGAARLIGCSFSTITRFEYGEDCNLSNATAILRWLNDPAAAEAERVRHDAKEGSDA